ncbi:MAG: DUF4292 domain-containing protein [Bacteroidaceae bacterium]|nr:DUF4292 domain-containing protein [Bacteroidaceae bacterium]
MKPLTYILTLLLLLSSCTASRQAAQSSDSSVSTGAPTTELPEAVTARLAMDLTDSELSCTGRLRMLRDDVVQLNLTFLGMNIGTLEFTPDTVLLVDRVNRQYVRARYGDIDALRERSIDFGVLQGLFWGENMEGRDDGQISWRYTAYDRINRHKIPASHVVRFKSGTTAAGFDMRLSEFGNDRKWPARTQLDETKFTRRDPNALFKALLNL